MSAGDQAAAVTVLTRGLDRSALNPFAFSDDSNADAGEPESESESQTLDDVLSSWQFGKTAYIHPRPSCLWHVLASIKSVTQLTRLWCLYGPTTRLCSAERVRGSGSADRHRRVVVPPLHPQTVRFGGGAPARVVPHRCVSLTHIHHSHPSLINLCFVELK
jgi:hypothetical protein